MLAGTAACSSAPRRRRAGAGDPRAAGRAGGPVQPGQVRHPPRDPAARAALRRATACWRCGSTWRSSAGRSPAACILGACTGDAVGRRAWCSRGSRSSGLARCADGPAGAGRPGRGGAGRRRVRIAWQAIRGDRILRLAIMGQILVWSDRQPGARRRSARTRRGPWASPTRLDGPAPGGAGDRHRRWAARWRAGSRRRRSSTACSRWARSG